MTVNMTKGEFLGALAERLTGLPEEERDRSLGYYAEMIDDMVEDGKSEEEAVAALGDVGDIARQIIGDTPMAMIVRRKVKGRRMSGLVIALLCLGFPVWFPLLCSAAVVVLSVYLVLWTVVLVFWVCMLSFGVCLLAGVVGGIAAIFLTGGKALFLIGCGLACGGFGILMYFAALYATRGLAALTVLFWRGIKLRIVRGNKEA